MDVLPAREASETQGWIVDGGDDGSGLRWRMVGDTIGAHEVL